MESRMQKYSKSGDQKKKRFRTEYFFFFFVYCLLSFFYFWVFLKENKTVPNYDLQFHMNRVLGLSNVFSSPINFSTFSAVGNPINIFYGWLTIYPLYALCYLTKNLVLSYNIFLLFLTLFSLLIGHYVVFYCQKKHTNAFLFSVMYTFSMYRGVCVFYRGALGEFICLALFPLILLALYRMLLEKKDSWILLAITISLLFYTHILSTVIACFFIGIFYLFSLLAMKDSKLKMTFTLLKAGIATCLLSLAYLVPMIEQAAFKPINPPLISILADRALSVEEFVFGSLRFDLSLYPVGVLPLILLIILLFNYFRLSKLSKCVVFVGLITLILTTNLFPWQFLQQTPIVMIQFPWRLIGPATLLICFSGVDFLGNVLSKKTFLILAPSITIFLLLANSFAVNKYLQVQDRHLLNNDDVSAMSTNMLTNDYAPVGFEPYQAQISEKYVTADDQAIASSFHATESELAFEFNSETNQFVRLPVYNFKGLELTVNGQVLSIENEAEALVTFVTKEKTNLVTVTYHYTFLARLAQIISLFSFVIIAILLVKKKTT